MYILWQWIIGVPKNGALNIAVSLFVLFLVLHITRQIKTTIIIIIYKKIDSKGVFIQSFVDLIPRLRDKFV